MDAKEKEELERTIGEAVVKTMNNIGEIVLMTTREVRKLNNKLDALIEYTKALDRKLETLLTHNETDKMVE